MELVINACKFFLVYLLSVTCTHVHMYFMFLILFSCVFLPYVSAIGPLNRIIL